jgi:pantoate--beta-alanine ligase
MNIIRSKQELRVAIEKFRTTHPGQVIGFVPTMGYLHSGHLSLIRAARQETDCVIVSLFVNPTQFGPTEDFQTYPRNEERDSRLCRQENADILFIPPLSDMYSATHSTTVHVKNLTRHLCGKFRPGHFDGVATIVLKLFNLIDPDISYFGQKDGQQCIVLQKMAKDLDLRTQIKIMPTVREPDGLAMSSRNVNLDPVSRQKAPLIYKVLLNAASQFQAGELKVKTIVNEARRILESDPAFKVQYLECRSLDNLSAMTTINRPCIIAVAAFLGGVRLIDNIILKSRDHV